MFRASQLASPESPSAQGVAHSDSMTFSVVQKRQSWAGMVWRKSKFQIREAQEEFAWCFGMAEEEMRETERGTTGEQRIGFAE